MQYQVNDESQSPNSFLHTSLCDGIAEISNHLGKDILFWWAAPGANYMAGFQLWISGRPSWVKQGEGRARGMFIVNQSFLSTTKIRAIELKKKRYQVYGEWRNYDWEMRIRDPGPRLYLYVPDCALGERWLRPGSESES